LQEIAFGDNVNADLLVSDAPFRLESIMQFRNTLRLRAAAAMLLTVALNTDAGAQTPSKLVLTATPLGAAAGDKMVPAGATVGVNVTFKYEGSETVSKVILTARLNGVKLAPQDDWKADGDNAVLEIASAKPNEEITRRLNVVVAMAPMPPGRQAEVAVEAKAGEASANASTKFPIGDCAAAFQAELTKLRISTISEVWPTADEMRKPDTTLPRMRFFRVGLRKSNDLAIIDRLAAGYQARLLTDYEFFREGMRYTTRRWSDELKAFAGQEPNPGICAVNSEMIEGIRKTISYVTARIEPPQKAYARAMEQLRKALNAADGEDLQKIALRAAADAGAKIENPPANVFKILELARDLLKDAKPANEQIDNLSLVESAAWVEAQALRSKKLSDLIENSITGISDAQKKSCVCAF
jgi:hypothetical protein